MRCIGLLQYIGQGVEDDRKYCFLFLNILLSSYIFFNIINEYQNQIMKKWLRLQKKNKLLWKSIQALVQC
jgi:hypothetical protein